MALRLLRNTNPRPVIGLSFGPNGRTLVAGGNGGIDVWDLHAEAKRTIPIHPTRTVYAFSHDPLGRWFYYSDPRGGGRIYDLASGEFGRFPGNEYQHHMISISGTKARVAISRGGGWNNCVECWVIEQDDALRLGWTVQASKWGMFHGLTFSPDGRKLAAVECRHKPDSSPRICPIILWNVGTGEIFSQFGSLPVTVGFDMCFTPDGKCLIAWEARWIEVWDVAAEKRVGELVPPGRAHFQSLAVHPSGKFFAAVGRDGYTRYWDPITLQPMGAHRSAVGKLHSIAFSDDGVLAAVGGENGAIAVWAVDEEDRLLR
jgi:WD40 repeat protein